ncbi:MAG: tryptophan-rich sensory protein [Candidatus Nanoarchaeia archaeon]|nr:tryptophan-rich sensory protein [Candidatus Nanoarchaeia archaeon]MDD5239556.1 tryptophan-rich sensory protein [Candidatus Nanoarchaeia archaeon]
MTKSEIGVGDAIKLIISLFFPIYAGVFGAIITSFTVTTWYAALNKPFFSPPGWIFGPVWTILYILMGVSLFLVWRKGINSEAARMAIAIFACQLAVNMFWSFAFFGFMAPLVALVTILLLWGLILLMIVNFYHISKAAAIMNIPYLLWVSFATILNIAIVVLN